jgi:hypothetical protein
MSGSRPTLPLPTMDVTASLIVIDGPSIAPVAIDVTFSGRNAPASVNVDSRRRMRPPGMCARR